MGDAARRTALLTAPLVALVLGCGGEEGRQPSGPPLVPPARVAEPGHNGPPVIERVRIRPRHPAAGVPLQAVVTARDPDGDAIHLRFRWSRNGRPLEARAPSVTLASARKGDRIEVEVVGSDGQAQSAPARASVRVRNRPPVLVRLSIDPRGTVEPGSVLHADPTARDPDGDPVRFRYE